MKNFIVRNRFEEILKGSERYFKNNKFCKNNMNLYVIYLYEIFRKKGREI